MKKAQLITGIFITILGCFAFYESFVKHGPVGYMAGAYLPGIGLIMIIDALDDEPYQPKFLNYTQTRKEKK